MSRAERLEELADALGEAERALLAAHLIATDLGFADMAAKLAALVSELRDEGSSDG
jgi:hypothetical protein